MNQIPAPRKSPDAEYGITGYWYYHWPALKCTFRTDFPNSKFPPDEPTEELTLREFVDLTLKYQKDSGYGRHWKPADRYYYYTAEGLVIAREDAVNIFAWNAVQLYRAEYIALSIELDQNPEDTLL